MRTPSAQPSSGRRRPETDGSNRSALARQNLGDSRLGPVQRQALELLSSGPLAVAALARALDRSYGNTVTMLLLLQERGLVTVTDGHRRVAKLASS